MQPNKNAKTDSDYSVRLPNYLNRGLGLPVFGETRILLLLSGLSHVLALAFLLTGGSIDLTRFSLLLLFVHWVAFGAAALLSLLQGVIRRLPLRLGVIFSLLLVVTVTLTISIVSESLIDLGPNPSIRIGGQLLVAIIIFSALLRYFYLEQHLSIQEQSELHARVQALQSRIRPHFLFNSMNIIVSLIHVEPDTAETVVEDLSELFRASLSEEGSSVPIDQEIDLCRRYLRIEQLRLGERLSINWNISNKRHSVKVPLLTLQPILENGIYHGIQPLPEGGTIDISICYEEDSVLIKVVNPVLFGTENENISKFSTKDFNQHNKRGNRMAIDNIRSRLMVLYGDKAELITRQEGAEFTTTIRLPSS